MSLILPTRTDLARYTFDISLDDVPLTFGFEWNDRDDGWYMSIFDIDKNSLLAGRRIVTGYPLISLYRDIRLPPGTLIAIDTSSQDLDPGFADLGDRVELHYVTRAELGI